MNGISRHVFAGITLAATLFFACNRSLPLPAVRSVNTYPNVKIMEGRGGIGPCEPSIAINPSNPDEMVVGTVLNRVARSADGGKSWDTGILQSPFGVWGDPVLAADAKGNFYYAHLSDPSGKNWADPELLDRIVVQKSKDKGLSWSEGSFAGYNPPKDQDKPWMAINPQNQEIYLTWTEFDRYASKNPKDKSRIMFARSSDGGLRWSEALRISEQEGPCTDEDETPEGAVPAVGPNGEIYVSWSVDSKIMFDRSPDGGRTWLDRDIEVAEQPGGWNFMIPGLNRTNGLPVTLCDRSSGPHRGKIYVVWADQREGRDDTDIRISSSSDGGDSWSPARRVNGDLPGRHNFLPWAVVDPATGYLYIVYYDRRNYPDDRTDVFLAFSKDGGAHFSEICISESPFNPHSTLFFGDYNNIAAQDGVVRPVWTRYEDGKLSVWTALVNLK